MKLDDYLTQRKITNTQFASTIGAERSHLSRVRRGVLAPTLDMMVRIAKATDRQVMPNDFLVSGEGGTAAAEVAA